MWTFYTKHKTFDRADEKELKAQLSTAYQAGLDGKEKVESTDALRTKTASNIAALNRTLELFPDLNPTRSLVRLSRERLDQEQKWLAHYDKCIENTKRGYAKMVAAAKAAGLIDDAYNSGKTDAEKAQKARMDAERAAEAKRQAEAAERARLEKEKQQQNDKNKQQNNNNNDKNKQQNNNDNKNGEQKRGTTLFVENMVVRNVDNGKKKDKKNKGLFLQQTKH